MWHFVLFPPWILKSDYRWILTFLPTRAHEKWYSLVKFILFMNSCLTIKLKLIFLYENGQHFQMQVKPAGTIISMVDTVYVCVHVCEQVTKLYCRWMRKVCIIMIHVHCMWNWYYFPVQLIEKGTVLSKNIMVYERLKRISFCMHNS